jgi:hypothetical protein
MKYLETYVDQQNRWSAIFGNQPLSLLNSTDRQKIARLIDNDLSPENLSCDGELPPSKVRAKYRMLSGAAAELLALDPNVVIHEFDPA